MTSTCAICGANVPPHHFVCVACIPTALGTPLPVPSMEPEEQSETVMAHRVWRWTAADGLYGPTGVRWKTSRMRAVCATWSHPAPNGWAKVGMPWPCWCGVNAFKLTEYFDYAELEHATGRSDGFTDCLPVVGVVELGGIVDEYERGYRAEYGQIQELTVLTALPVDVSSLEEQYEVPVRVMSYADWKNEWEITYGRDRAESSGDRESDTTDQNPQAGTPPNIAAAIRAVAGTPGPTLATTTGTSTHGPLWTNAQLNRLLTAVTNTPAPKGWRRWWYRLTGHNTYAWTREWWFLLFGGAGAVVFGMVGLLLPSDLRLVPWLVGAGVFLICCGLDLILARKLRKSGFWR